jgi:hypothetical protein
MADGLLRLEVLGPLRLWRDGVELDPGSGQQPLLLALLLARAGRPISTTELIHLIWADETCRIRQLIVSSPALHGPWRTAVPVTLGLDTRMRVDLTAERTRHWQRLENCWKTP